MKNISVGDVVKSKKTGLEHVVENIDIIDGKTYIFTQDIKYFPIEDLTKTDFQNLKDVFIKFIDGKKLDSNESKLMKDKLEKWDIKLFVWDSSKIDERIKNYKSGSS